MERAPGATSTSALCILMECETALIPFINEFIYVCLDGICPGSETRLAKLFLIAANCWQGGANKGDRGSRLLSVRQAVEANRVIMGFT